MERLIKTKIFQLVGSEELTTDKNEWLTAYKEFAHSLCSLLFSEETFSDRYNLLTFTIAELQVMEMDGLVSSPKKKQ